MAAGLAQGLASTSVAASAGVTSAAGTTSSWVASVNTAHSQFGGTTYGAFQTDYGGTAPGEGADTGAKLEFLHTQLNRVGNERVVLERFRLLGPSHRRQGGALRAACCDLARCSALQRAVRLLLSTDQSRGAGSCA